MSQKLTGPALVAYLRQFPSSDDRSWAADELESMQNIIAHQAKLNEAAHTLIGVLRAAVLQSEKVQAWKRDAARLDWLESCEDSHGFCHAGYGDYIYYAHQVTGMPSVREVIDAAMENT